MGNADTKLRERLTFGDRPDREERVAPRQASEGFAPIVQRISSAAAQPFMPKTREKPGAEPAKLAHTYRNREAVGREHVDRASLRR